MNVLLVTSAKNMAEKFAALNPELEYAAIVVDDVESAKKTLAQIGLSKFFVCPMTELIKCVEYLWYDYIIRLQDGLLDKQLDILRGLPTEKIIGFGELHTKVNFKTEGVLRLYQEHAQDFEMFATGISTARAGLDVTRFKRKLFNFAKPSQDLYYDFNIAKHVILCGGHNRIRYALIGLTPYSFHFDLSQTFIFKCRILPYLVAFNDLHNFPVPIDVYKKFLRKEWLAKKLPSKYVNVKTPYGSNGAKVIMTQKSINSYSHIYTWLGKYYPKTRDENIKILDDYLTLCEENNIRPVIFTVPVTEKYMSTFNKQLLEEFRVLVGKALNKHPNARFLDGWKLQGFTYTDFYNHGHLNGYGAAKFSTYLNDFIEQFN